jgi:hypothetical protein
VITIRITTRDYAILRELEEGRFLTREQVQMLFFGTTQGPQKAQERLRKLLQVKKVKRKRIGSTGQYVYYLVDDRWSEKWNHWISLNWVKACLVAQAKSWHKISVFKREYVLGDLRTDAIVAIDNTVKKERRILFVESDNGHNQFRDKYKASYENTAYSIDPPWWAKNGYPSILVVTNRPERVKDVVESSPVTYHVATVEEIKEDIFKCLGKAYGNKIENDIYKPLKLGGVS